MYVNVCGAALAFNAFAAFLRLWHLRNEGTLTIYDEAFMMHAGLALLTGAFGRAWAGVRIVESSGYLFVITFMFLQSVFLDLDASFWKSARSAGLALTGAMYVASLTCAPAKAFVAAHVAVVSVSLAAMSQGTLPPLYAKKIHVAPPPPPLERSWWAVSTFSTKTK